MTSHTDAEALLKLADDLEWLALASNKDFALHNGRGKMTKASIAIRQAASQGSAGGEQSEVQSREAIAQALLDRFVSRGEVRLGGPTFPRGIKMADLPSSYADDFYMDADAVLAAIPALAQSPDQIEITRLSGLLAEAQKIIAEYKASTIAGVRDGLAQASLTPELMNRTTVSCSGKEITIACNDHDTKDALMDILIDTAYAVSSADCGSTAK